MKYITRSAFTQGISESFFIRTQKWMAFSYLAFLLVTWIVARFNKDAPANS
jgi:hypothetical protein